MKKRDLLLILLSGFLFTLSFPKYDLEFLAWVALIPLFFAIEDKGFYHSFVLGFLAGIVSYLGILYWIIVAVHNYGNVPLILSIFILLLLVAYMSAYLGVFTLLNRFFQVRFGTRGFLLAPFLWVSLEYLRSFLLTGFPWANLGHSQYLNLPFVQMADITGVYGLSFVIVMVNGTLYQALSQGSRRSFPVKEAIVSGALLVLFLVYGYVRMDTVARGMEGNPPLKVGLVQGNIDQAVKWDESFQKETLKIYEKLSFRIAEGKPELIIWPETATPFFFQDEKEYQPIVLNIPQKANAYLLFGTPSYKVDKGKVNHYNSAFLVSPSGALIGRYDKIHLVPFGEYVPLSEILFFVGSSLGEGIGDFKSGREIRTLSTPKGRFGVLICFEIIFPDLCRKFVKNGAEFLVTITNDAWFGETSAPYQHLAIAAFRAVENRVFIPRAANTGISAIIDPRGRIVSRGDIFTEETLSGTLRLSNVKTFYTLYGDVFAWLCSGLSVLLLLSALLSGRKKD
jgi:apolipoprotein N-acyltransferase